MESRSSESRGYGYSSYGSYGESRSSESRSSESRVSYPSYGGVSSESRVSSESHEYLGSAESRVSGESRQVQVTGGGRPQYNCLEDIDRLIEELEAKEPNNVAGFERLQKAWDKRSKKLAELKKLRDEARRVIEEEKSVQRVEQDSEQLDGAIDGIKRLIKKREIPSRESKPKKASSPSSYSYYDSSESRDSGESRW